MKFLIVACLFVIGINANKHQDEWTKFKLTHLKTYKSLDEENLRFKIFSENLKTIEEHNARYRNGEVSYFLSTNKFADMTNEEFNALMINKKLSNTPKFETTRFVKDPNLHVPDSIDWRDKANFTIKEQGICASCWAFSTTGTLEGYLALERNQIVQLSEQELIDCSREYYNFGCDGGFPSSALEYVKDNGLSSEESYPYRFIDGTCKNGTKILKSITDYVAVDSSEEDMKTAVGTVGLLSVGVRSGLIEWQLYGGGIFDHPACKPPPNHAVVIVGYGQENSKGYWIIKNCWGTTWGENGYMKLVRGTNQCGVKTEPIYPKL